MSKRKQHAPEFKAKVALEALKGGNHAIVTACLSSAPWFKTRV